ncbi:RHS repeat domain-containing protein [Bacillus salitolerans]|uniref:RHS repeat domain-containing protein n=1 Tax=Bacillus salitolerans TaxID=1437434 RepID=A0ABW4LWS3_9BACI
MVDARFNKTEFSYNDKDELIQVVKPDGSVQTLAYSIDEEQLTSFTNASNETIKYNYDEDENNTVTVTPMNSTIIRDFNEKGQIVGITTPISLNENIIPNHGFETWDVSVPGYWQNIASGSVRRSTDRVNGYYSLELTGNTSGEAKVVSRYFPVLENTKYVVSWFLKSLDASDIEIRVNWYVEADINTYIGNSPIRFINNKKEWAKKAQRINSPFGAKFARVVITSFTGTTLFDNVQMEKGDFVNDYNLLLDPGFEETESTTGKPIHWNLRSSLNTIADASYINNGRNGTSKGLRIYGSGDNKYFGQEIKIKAEKDVTLLLSGWSRADGISSTGGPHEIVLYINYEDLDDEWLPLIFTKANHGWEYRELNVTLKGNAFGFQVYAKVENQSGAVVHFDDIKFRTITTSTAILSEYNIVTNGSFEFDLDNSGMSDDWKQSIQPGTTATMNWVNDRNEAQVGKYSLLVKDTGGWAIFANNTKEPVLPDRTYTAAVTIKTKGVTSTSINGGGIIKFDVYDTNGSYLGEYMTSNPVSGSVEGERVYVEVDGQKILYDYPSATSIRVSVGTVHPIQGSLYFDNVRFESRSVQTTLQYDVTNNYVTTVTNELGKQTLFTPDERGNIEQIILPTGGIATFEYNSLDLLESAQTTAGLLIEYDYDSNGNVMQIDYKDPVQNTVIGSIHQSYNEANQVETVTDQLNRVTTLSYNIIGNMEEILYPNDNLLSLNYTDINQIKTITYNNETIPAYSFKYNDKGFLTSVTKNGTDTSSYQFDQKLNRITSITYPNNHAVSYTYDPSGKVTSISSQPLNHPILVTRYEYDQAGLLASAFGPNDERVYHIFDEAGRIRKRNSGNGTTFAYDTYMEYDAAGQLIYYSNSQGEQTYLEHELKYDDNGNRTEVISGGGSRIEYNYDTANRLLKEVHYDPNDVISYSFSYEYTGTYGLLNNRTAKKSFNTVVATYQYNAANELVSVNGIPFQYDANGNLLKDDRFQYQYNPANQLVEVNTLSDSLVARYEYNHEGLRTKKITPSKTEKYFYSAGELSYITDETDKLKYSFTRTVSGTLVSMTDHTGTTKRTYYYIRNSHSDVVELRDSNGNRVVYYKYDAFGVPLTSEGTATTGNGELLREANPFRYVGYFYDEETANYYLKARYYNPDSGRFLTRDLLPGINLYTYASCNPVRFIDPSGMISVEEDSYGSYSYDWLNDVTKGGLLGFSGAALDKFVGEKVSEKIKPFVEQKNKTRPLVKLQDNRYLTAPKHVSTFSATRAFAKTSIGRLGAAGFVFSVGYDLYEGGLTGENIRNSITNNFVLVALNLGAFIAVSATVTFFAGVSLVGLPAIGTALLIGAGIGFLYSSVKESTGFEFSDVWGE